MRRKNLKFFLVGIIIASAVGYLIYGASKDLGVYYVTVNELTNRAEVINRPLRVSGRVVEGSVERHLRKISSDKGRVYEFMITDGKKNLAISYGGALPDTFKPGTQVVVEGVYNKKEDTFEAKRVMARCPSKYQAD